MYEKLKKAGYKYVKKLPGNEHLLREVESGEFEIWFNNKNHGSYGLIFKNTHLEFAREFHN